MIPLPTLFGQNLQGVDRWGTKWTTTREEGRWSSPEVRRSRVEKSQKDGAHPSTSTLAAGTIVLEGVLRAPTNEALLRSQRDLMTLADIREGELVWVDALGATWQEVELDGVIRATMHGDKVMLWQLQVTAPDPARYGPEVTFRAVLEVVAAEGEGWQWPVTYPIDWRKPAGGDSSNAVMVSNSGNTVMWPVLRLTTTAPSPRVTCTDTGAWIQYLGRLEPGQWLLIDCRNRTVLLNGEINAKHLTSWSGDWLAIHPESTNLITFTAAGPDPEASLIITTREGAYL